MARSKVDFFGETLIDLTSDTVTAGAMLQGTTAHDSAGNLIVGTIPNNGDVSANIDPSVMSEIVIPAGYTSGGTIKVIVITHYYYSGVKLPKLPSEIASYPYAWIRKNNSTGYYDLILSTKKNYMYSSSTVRGSGTAGGEKWFRISISDASSATSWGSAQSHSYSGWTVDANRTIFWANEDIMASASSSNVHFAGSEPIPVT